MKTVGEQVEILIKAYGGVEEAVITLVDTGMWDHTPIAVCGGLLGALGRKVAQQLKDTQPSQSEKFPPPPPISGYST